MVRPATESFELWMKYDFATAQLGGFTAPALPLARWIEFFQLRIIVLRRPLSASTFLNF